jgi:acetyl-CoA acetyltransferase
MSLTLYWNSSTTKNPDDIVITLAIRTPLAKAKKGGFKDTSLEYIVYALLKEVRERSKLDPALVEDICLGNVSVKALSTPLISADNG